MGVRHVSMYISTSHTTYERKVARLPDVLVVYSAENDPGSDGVSFSSIRKARVNSHAKNVSKHVTELRLKWYTDKIFSISIAHI